MKEKFKLKRIKGLVVLGVALLVNLIGCVCVSADEGVWLYSEHIDNHLSVVRLDGRVRYFHLKIYKFLDKPTYCIELGKDITEKLYSYTMDYSSLGYSEEQIEYIQKIGYYGYEYPLHNDDYHYYMAAQELIWEYLSDVEVRWTSELVETGYEIDVSKYKNEILELIEMDSILPSFNLGTYDYFVSDRIEILDTNYVLSNYEIIDSDGLDAFISNNNLIINNDGSKVGEYTIRLKKKSYIDSDPLIFYVADSQKLYSVGRNIGEEVSVKVNISGASLKLQKYDSNTLTDIPLGNGSLGNAVYELYDSKNVLISTMITDESGQAVIDNLPFGTYTLKEIQPSYGYKLDDTVYFIEINSKDNEFIVYEDPDLKKLDIYKTYGDEELVEEGIVFDIYDSENGLYTIINTDDNGYGSVLLPYGDYLVIQKNTKDGYKMIEDFNLTINEESDEVITYKLNDEKIEVLVMDEPVIKNPKTYDGIKKTLIIIGVNIVSLLVIFICVLKNVCYNYNREEDTNEFGK